MRGTKYLSEVIDYRRDIEPYFLISIWSGVGSGKNTFIENFIRGAVPDAPKMNVLMITSRRKKVDETYLSFLADSANELKRRIPTDVSFAGAYNKSVVCTNAAIESYIEHFYSERDETTYLWELFDLIVIDEAHSLVMDATYQTAPFYVYDLIQKIISQRKEHEIRCKHIILMTGTFEPIRKLEFTERVHKIQVFSECRHIEPKNVHFIRKDDVKKSLASRLSHGGKMIYFANHTDRVTCLASDLDRYNDKIAVSFSNSDARKDLQTKDSGLYGRMLKTEEEIERKSLLPKEICLFITTSRYKEGINIKNQGITTLYVEAHNPCDVKQMVGRLRAEDFVKDLYIVVDAKEHTSYSSESMIDEQIECKYACYEVGAHDSEGYKTAPANDYLINHCADKERLKYTCFIQKKFKYVRYSYLDKCFKYYFQKKIGTSYYAKNTSEFLKSRDNGKLDLLVKQWFPDAKVERFNERESENERMYRKAWDYWNEQDIQIGVLYSKEQLDVWKAKFAKIYGMSEKAQWNTILKKFSHYALERDKSHKTGRSKFIDKTAKTP